MTKVFVKHYCVYNIYQCSKLNKLSKFNFAVLHVCVALPMAGYSEGLSPKNYVRSCSGTALNYVMQNKSVRDVSYPG